MPQFLVKKSALGDGKARLDGDEAHHARDVFRLKEGDTIRLFDGDGKGFEGQISHMGKKDIDIRIFSTHQSEAPPAVLITLGQSLIPHQAMDDVIQQATELGVEEIIPVASRRSIVRLSSPRSHSKKEHWNKVALAGCKQCERLKVPVIRGPMDIEDVPEIFGNYDLVLVADSHWADESLRSCMSKVFNIKKILVIVGPEGGLTYPEIEMLKNRGARIVSLGGYTLRSQTAAIHLLSVISHLYGL
ncbi:MAG: 16S rRNA (uracil(1498)-N(3))-methyltransferase [Candidatus Omnitrophica bacterium]|nr:16S rRNA (uracil(1498)-N(3))-methyltransferase [Candidatus Omnitrophota bacterium]